jgi:hypothetical protein
MERAVAASTKVLTAGLGVVMPDVHIVAEDYVDRVRGVMSEPTTESTTLLIEDGLVMRAIYAATRGLGWKWRDKKVRSCSQRARLDALVWIED